MIQIKTCHFNDTFQYVTYLHNGRDQRVSNLLPDTDQFVTNDTDAMDNRQEEYVMPYVDCSLIEQERNNSCFIIIHCLTPRDQY